MDGKYQRKTFSQPTVIRTYNGGMGGTDSFDQRVSYIRPKLKSKKWMPRVFTHFLAASVVNAFIIFKSKRHEGNRKYSTIVFMRALIEQLAEAFIDELKANKINIITPGGRYESTYDKNSDRFIGTHIPVVQEVPEESRDNPKADRYKRGNCVSCKTKVNSFCMNCSKYMCLTISIGKSKSCWMDKHGLDLPSTK